ncbi:DUF3710 domain-containing protein [Mycobacterium sp. CBMA271]|uniref:DUF3710 domain-containing protein n=1 Tax=unclassified Mycobacteroides TaxID=2618759 RepID=UPI0012DF89DB|nr:MULTISPECIES: DUF3710 domain-containing protein [unclassified Mycobacteroides]MUM17309.1 hypothetical protein [Mycobacteroides sp. CBMA 326]MUM23856.1 DUF3710 domain-containing protein [Mycobacteroides sp. CBMA 271]
MALHRSGGLNDLDDADASASDAGSAEAFDGPYEIEDFDSPEDAATGRLNLGSVLIPVPEAGQIQVELTAAGTPGAVFVLTPNGRYSVAAYAAPKSAGLWREIAGELAESLRKESAEVSIADGPWGREVVGVAEGGSVRFIGVDGYRWMIRCVLQGPAETFDALAEEARDTVADTVVRRDDSPYPVRTPLPVELPEPMLEQLQAAQAQAMAEAEAAQQELPPQDDSEPTARRSVSGSAMQQLRSTITGG